jgi:hypothetical protein
MADHLRALQLYGGAIATVVQPASIPTVVISSGDQPPEPLALHRQIAAASESGRHLVATRSRHWVQFDEPELIVTIVRELVERERADAAVGR